MSDIIKSRYKILILILFFQLRHDILFVIRSTLKLFKHGLNLILINYKKFLNFTEQTFNLFAFLFIQFFTL